MILDSYSVMIEVRLSGYGDVSDNKWVKLIVKI
jgi:hypothetical protein